jgi:hypothetical protein
LQELNLANNKELNNQIFVYLNESENFNKNIVKLNLSNTGIDENGLE